jgi:ssDNA-binding Zn-finger/Zn-ribbon topoisomerase 1
MATRRAKIASQRKTVKKVQNCPECENEMEMTRVIRSQGGNGMFWVCSNNRCGTFLSTAGVKQGELELA